MAVLPQATPLLHTSAVPKYDTRIQQRTYTNFTLINSAQLTIFKYPYTERSFRHRRSTDDFFDNKNNIAMYIVAPLLFLFFCGCCGIYGCYKCRKYMKENSPVTNFKKKMTSFRNVIIGKKEKSLREKFLEGLNERSRPSSAHSIRYPSTSEATDDTKRTRSVMSTPAISYFPENRLHGESPSCVSLMEYSHLSPVSNMTESTIISCAVSNENHPFEIIPVKPNESNVKNDEVVLLSNVARKAAFVKNGNKKSIQALDKHEETVFRAPIPGQAAFIKSLKRNDLNTDNMKQNVKDQNYPQVQQVTKHKPIDVFEWTARVTGQVTSMVVKNHDKNFDPHHDNGDNKCTDEFHLDRDLSLENPHSCASVDSSLNEEFSIKNITTDRNKPKDIAAELPNKLDDTTSSIGLESTKVFALPNTGKLKINKCLNEDLDEDKPPPYSSTEYLNYRQQSSVTNDKTSRIQSLSQRQNPLNKSVTRNKNPLDRIELTNLPYKELEEKTISSDSTLEDFRFQNRRKHQIFNENRNIEHLEHHDASRNTHSAGKTYVYPQQQLNEVDSSSPENSHKSKYEVFADRYIKYAKDKRKRKRDNRIVDYWR